jgi:hypothetical protein
MHWGRIEKRERTQRGEKEKVEREKGDRELRVSL